jgi:Flp pilus assembly protein TadD
LLVEQAITLTRAGQYEQAIRRFDEALALSPSAAAFVGRGVAYDWKGEPDRRLLRSRARLRVTGPA